MTQGKENAHVYQSLNTGCSNYCSDASSTELSGRNCHIFPLLSDICLVLSRPVQRPIFHTISCSQLLLGSGTTLSNFSTVYCNTLLPKLDSNSVVAAFYEVICDHRIKRQPPNFTGLEKSATVLKLEPGIIGLPFRPSD